jgi:hypothetical protein
MTAITMPAGRRPGWRRLLDFNMFTGIVLAAVGGLVGDLIGTAIHAASISYYSAEAGQNDIRRRWPSTSPRARGSAGISACAPITRSSRSSTSSASVSSS